MSGEMCVCVCILNYTWLMFFLDRNYLWGNLIVLENRLKKNIRELKHVSIGEVSERSHDLTALYMHPV